MIRSPNAQWLLAALMVAVVAPSWAQDRPQPRKLDDEARAECAQWLKRSGTQPGPYVVSKFSTYELVLLGETHEVKENCEFVATLIGPLYKAGVRTLFMDRMYRFFRENAAESYRKPDPPLRVTAVNERGEPAAWAGSFRQGPREGFYHTTAMLNAYFSRLEHALVLIVPFATFDEAGFNLVKYIGSNWDDKYRRLFDVEKHEEAKALYDRMKVAKERYRNPISHGGFEKGGASLYFHVPTVGALPASLVAVRDSWTFSFIPIPEASYEEICALLDDVDAFLGRAHTRYGWKFAESGLDVVFDGKTHAVYRRAMASDATFEEMLEKLSREVDYYPGMNDTH